MIKRYTHYFWVAFACICLLGCQQWDDRISIANDNLGKTLLAQIEQQSDLSTFRGLLVKSGYDKLIASSQNFTVFAPNNKALATLDMATLQDSTSLKMFVGNHIALQTYAVTQNSVDTRIQLINGKFVTLNKNKLGDLTIATPNAFAANGVLHVLDTYSQVLPNIWGFINDPKNNYAQNNIIGKLKYTAFNPLKAIVDSISATTGRPVYRPGTGFEQKNAFTDLVYNLEDESKQYTYFILTDNTLATEITKVLPFFKTSTTDSSYNLAAYNVVKDVAVQGYYTPDNLPATLQSKFGVTIPILKSAIINTIKLSNGIAYVLNKADFNVKEKIAPIVVQAESSSTFMQAVTSTTFAVMDKINPNTNENFRTILFAGHGVTNFWVRYRVPQVPAAKYKVYWVAFNDQSRANYTSSGVTPPATLTQRLAMGNVVNTTFPYITVTLNNYSEVLLGEYTTNNYGYLDVFLQGSGTTPIVLDYFKLVPVL